MGYLPQSLRNYLLKLGWSYGNEEFINDQEAIKLFNIENINKSPARFDFSKLQSVNKFYIKNLENAKLYDLIINDLNNHEFIKKRQEVVNNNEKLRVISALNYIKEKVATINELIDPCLIYLDNYRSAINKQYQEKITSNIDMINKINILINEINIWQIDDIKLKFNDFCQNNNLKIKDFGPILRILLTFSSKSSGSIFEVIFNLGKIEVLNRISLSQSS
jgi:glutamyl-tRNA synthetase